MLCNRIGGRGLDKLWGEIRRGKGRAIHRASLTVVSGQVFLVVGVEVVHRTLVVAVWVGVLILSAGMKELGNRREK